MMKKKNLIGPMMARTQIPIIIDGGPLVNFTLNSFLKVSITVIWVALLQKSTSAVLWNDIYR